MLSSSFIVTFAHHVDLSFALFSLREGREQHVAAFVFPDKAVQVQLFPDGKGESNTYHGRLQVHVSKHSASLAGLAPENLQKC